MSCEAGRSGDKLLAHPSASQQARLGVREGPLEVNDIAIVGRLAAEVVWILEVEGFVG